MPNLLVEIGTEELPSPILDVVYAELGKSVEKNLSAARLSFGKVFVEATPRRTAFFVENLAAKQEDKTEEISGPSHDKAYDPSGKPTRALEGFLKSKGAELKDVRIKETPKGKFISVLKSEKGKAVSAVLPQVILDAVTAVNFPKGMRWEVQGFRFPRPIRWALVLLDSKVLSSFKIADVKAAGITYGHRFLSPKPVSIRQADWKSYQAALKKKNVILSLDARKAKIRSGLKDRFKQKKVDEELVHITAQLAEDPFLMEGKYSQSYLELPSEVLASCMKKNQKIFACYGPKDKLVNRFVAVLNGKRNKMTRIRSDYENVLESRLKDARYFYDADTKIKLVDRVPDLEQIVYIGKLGHMFDKVTRMENLAEHYAYLLGRQDLKEKLKRVAYLSKADLMTQMVFEFPDLQGIVGREYAVETGENEEVALAIGTQYLPKNLSESYEDLAEQMTPLGAIFGILDRLDLLVGAFGIGIIPTGSQDPYALRRAGGSLVKLIRSFGFQFSLLEAIDHNIKLYGNSLKEQPDSLKEKLLQFLSERVAFELQVKPGTRAMEIFQAVWQTSHDFIGDVFDRFDVLSGLSDKDPSEFRKTVKVVERTSNILKNTEVKNEKVDPGLFESELEKTLYDLVVSKSGEIEEFLNRRDYKKATILFGNTFYEPVHSFFDHVMVNAEDPAIRRNRHALLKSINSLYTGHLADLSLLSRID